MEEAKFGDIYSQVHVCLWVSVYKNVRYDKRLQLQQKQKETVGV